MQPKMRYQIPKYEPDSQTPCSENQCTLTTVEVGRCRFFARNPSTTPKPSRLQSVVPLGRNISLYFWWLLETAAFFCIFAIKKFSGKHSCLTFDSCSCGLRYIKSGVSASLATRLQPHTNQKNHTRATCCF